MNSKPSKSARKREAQAVQALGERLLGMSDADLSRMPLDDELRVLVNDTRALRSNSALRRQRLYLAKVLRNTDLDALHAAVAALERQDGTARRLFHDAERWRDRLLQEGGPALAELEQRVGGPLPELAAHLDALRRQPPEREAKRLRRDVFRDVHAALGDALRRDSE